MSDHIVRAIAPGIRLVAAVTTEIAEEGRKRHDCSPLATAALGRAMTAALLLSETLKGDECITVRISGDGPLGDVIADTPTRHCVRGYVHNPSADLPLDGGKLPVGKGVGKGMLHVTRFNPQREVFTGTVELVSGEIAEDVTRYLLESEQIPSTVGLGVLIGPDGSVSGSAGFLVQAMPDATDAVVDNLEKNLALVSSPSHLAMEGVAASGIARLLLAGVPETTIYEAEPVTFGCTCSRERVLAMLGSLDGEEVCSMLMEGGTEIRCNFCNELYRLGKDELEEVLAGRNASAEAK